MSQTLKQEVWDLGRCTGCGLCVAVCNKGVLEFNEKASHHPNTRVFKKMVGYREVNLDPCRLCDEPSEEVCPRMVDWEPKPLGRVVSIKPLVTQNPLNDLLMAAFKLGAINGAIATDLEPWSKEPEPRSFSRAEELADVNLAVPLFSAGLKLVNKTRRLNAAAVVGPPCWIQGMKKLEDSAMPVLATFQKPTYVKISYFCSGALYPDVLPAIQKEFGVPLWEISGIELGRDGSELIFTWPGGKRSVPLTDLAKHTAEGCARCTDYSGEQSDIAVGNLGSEKNAKTAIIRTPLGEQIVDAAAKMKYIEVAEPTANARNELMSYIEGKRKRGSAVEVDKAFLSVLFGLKMPAAREDALKKLEMLSKLGKKEV